MEQGNARPLKGPVKVPSPPVETPDRPTSIMLSPFKLYLWPAPQPSVIVKVARHIEKTIKFVSVLVPVPCASGQPLEVWALIRKAPFGANRTQAPQIHQLV